MKNPFKIVSEYTPAGDQPKAIKELIAGVKRNEKDQVLLGVTGSGKTFTMAHVIEAMQKPALIMAHNKTLAAQLYNEMKSFFPNNAVEYFVSYYDYYQPEAYIARTDTFIEKDSAINEQIDLLRHSATRSLMEREDVIVISSVSCIYGIGSPESYSNMVIPLKRNTTIKQSELLRKLVELSYTRNDINFTRGSFRVRGDNIDIFPSHYQDLAWRLDFFGDDLETIKEFDPLTGKITGELEETTIFPNNHYVTPRPTLIKSVELIKRDLKIRLKELDQQKKLVEAQRLGQRTEFDLEMLHQTGTCKGIENYSRYLSGRKEGEPPPTLFEYFPKDSLLFIDESHVTVPQIGAMYMGDSSRKNNLVDYGFRLPSAKDNRPLKFAEWDNMRPQTIFVSATPGKFEIAATHGVVVEQVIRPTGLIDPICIIRPVDTQVDDLLKECKDMVKKGLRVLATTLTKKMAENLTDYLLGLDIKVAYLHSDIQTLERVEILNDLRKGKFDVVVGVNLLREGLDIPECGLVAILDADKEGFLRSETSLIQTIGRAARHIDGRAILYADKITNSIEKAISETNRRRKIQQEYNEKHNITPTTINKAISEFLKDSSDKKNNKKPANIVTSEEELDKNFNEKDLNKYLEKLKKQMVKFADNLEFEAATKVRDKIHHLEDKYLNIKEFHRP